MLVCCCVAVGVIGSRCETIVMVRGRKPRYLSTCVDLRVRAQSVTPRFRVGSSVTHRLVLGLISVVSVAHTLYSGVSASWRLLIGSFSVVSVKPRFTVLREPSVSHRLFVGYVGLTSVNRRPDILSVGNLGVFTDRRRTYSVGRRRSASVLSQSAV